MKLIHVQYISVCLLTVALVLLVIADDSPWYLYFTFGTALGSSLVNIYMSGRWRR